MLLIISGFAGSGKSSLADSLGKKLEIKVVHASSLLREMSTQGISALENASPEKIQDWWESSEAKEFMKKRQKNGSLDRALDEKLKKIADKGNVILDSWTMPYLYNGKAFKVWLDASAEVRAKRVASRDNLNYEVVLAKIKTRDLETKALYERLYHFKMGENLEIFNLVINTDNLVQEKVFAEVLSKIKE
ncbi:MAG: cytidylate kinase family protein [archaeon]|nr:cytidylate kinase family protein [archaeon]